jgi:hypothetical protein
MARKGPKVYELAEELGVQPHAVLEAAVVLGIHAQNRIARLTLEAASRVRAHLRAAAEKNSAEGSAGKPSTAAPPAPSNR